MKIIQAEDSHKEQLLVMNRQLAEDEQFDRPSNPEQMSKRWDDFLNQDKYGVYLFEEQKEVVGYAVVHLDQTPLYLRHFFIDRNHRRKGYGTQCFWSLLDHLNTKTVDLDVMSWNQRGMGFWKSLGFVERCRVLTLKGD